MPEYTYNDFLNTLDEKGALILNEFNKHIKSYCPEYKPVDIKPTDKTNKTWRLHYRKKPKVGKAIFSAYSEGNKLSVRFCLLSSMTYEFLLRQNEFSAKFKTSALKQMLCCVSNSCRNYGGNTICAYRQYYWINNRLMMACPYPWVSIDDFDENAATDIALFIDIQMRHMIQDAKEIKGTSYTEETTRRCKEVQIVPLDEIAADIDTFQAEDYIKKPARLAKYAKMYGLVPMGDYQGLWYYHNANTVCRTAADDYGYTKIPEGSYATVTIEDPFAFSVWRIWNFIAGWLYDNKKSICPVELIGTSVPYFTRFYRQGEVEYMTMYVPVFE